MAKDKALRDLLIDEVRERSIDAAAALEGNGEADSGEDTDGDNEESDDTKEDAEEDADKDPEEDAEEDDEDPARMAKNGQGRTKRAANESKGKPAGTGTSARRR